jgi:predicted metal-dependent HD superfamily phosphohydrolase
MRHLVDVLARVDELASGSHAPALVRLAAFYHGAVFDPPPAGAGCRELPRGANWEDEAAGATLARAELEALGVPAGRAGRVADLLGAMTDLVPLPDDADSAVLLDASLSLLAADPQRYKVYLAQVREENDGVLLRDFLAARIVAISAMLARPRLFASPDAAAWERAARDNMAAELLRSRKELLRLDAEGSEGQGSDAEGSEAEGSEAEPSA